MAVLLAATLLLKLLVPAGYMVSVDQYRIGLTACSGMMPTAGSAEMPGMRDRMPGHGKSADHGGGEHPCPFASLSASMIAAVDSARIAEPIAFLVAICVLGLAPPPIAEPSFARPPLRGPPATF